LKPNSNYHFRKSNLRRHERNKHLECDRKFECPSCGAEIGRSDNFDNHLKELHGVKMSLCKRKEFLRSGEVGEGDGRRRRRRRAA
jgi:hypothetical protein